MIQTRYALLCSVVFLFASCSPEPTQTGFYGSSDEVRIITLDPGHFHAGLVHKYDYELVNPLVHVYAPPGPDLESHLTMIERFNTRPEDPTGWELEVYRGEDYLEKMLEERAGNVLVVAGNNAKKIGYINQAVRNGINVLADKPMIIHPDRFELLKEVLETADRQGLVVNDIMTERHEITSILQRELSRIPELFGTLVSGTPEDPAITKESVHFFAKNVAGAPLIRPAWFFDVEQQGEAIVDVSTHLTDLIMWQSFPEEAIDYRKAEDGVEVLRARSWHTPLTPSQFKRVTTQERYPDYLLPHVAQDSVLNVRANGEFVFKVRGVHGKVAVLWGYENPEGGDTHFSRMRGTLADLVIRQDQEQDYVATLYVEPGAAADPQQFGLILNRALQGLSERYPDLNAVPSAYGWEIQIPSRFREGHEDHFTRVTEQYLASLRAGALPVWERTNLLTKYYVTTRAHAMSR